MDGFEKSEEKNAPMLPLPQKSLRGVEEERCEEKERITHKHAKKFSPFLPSSFSPFPWHSLDISERERGTLLT